MKQFLGMLALGVASVGYATDEVVMRVPSMMCEGCVHEVTEALQSLPDAEKVAVDLETKRVVVHGKEGRCPAPDAIKAALAHADKPAEEVVELGTDSAKVLATLHHTDGLTLPITPLAAAVHGDKEIRTVLLMVSLRDLRALQPSLKEAEHVGTWEDLPFPASEAHFYHVEGWLPEKVVTVAIRPDRGEIFFHLPSAKS